MKNVFRLLCLCFFLTSALPLVTVADIAGSFDVVRVVDGDTIDVRQSKYGQIFRIRFLLVDAPETKSVRKRGVVVRAEPFGQEAKQFVIDTIHESGYTVYIESDGADRERSVGNRRVALVYLGDKNGECLNELLAAKGLAKVRSEYGYKTQESDDKNKNSQSRKASYKTTKRLLDLETKAKSQSIGIWSLP